MLLLLGGGLLVSKLTHRRRHNTTGEGVRVELGSYVELAPGADTPEKRTRCVPCRAVPCLSTCLPGRV